MKRRPFTTEHALRNINMERRYFTIAHEFGHILMHEGRAQDEKLDREANQFAASLLLPHERFCSLYLDLREHNFLDRVFQIKKYFGVCCSTVLKKLNDEKMKLCHGEDPFELFHEQYESRFQKKLSRMDEPDPMHWERFIDGWYLALVKKAVGEGKITKSRAAELLDCLLVEILDVEKDWND